MVLRRLALIFFFFACVAAHADEAEARVLLVELVKSARGDRSVVLEKLADQGEPVIGEMYAAWRMGKVFEVEGSKQVLVKADNAYTDLLTGQKTTPDSELKINRASRGIRKEMKRLVDILDLSSPDFAARIQAAEKLGMSQNEEYLPELRRKVDKQSDAQVKEAFQEAVAISELKNGNLAEKIAAIKTLGEMKSLPSRGFITKLVKEFNDDDLEGKTEIAAAAKLAFYQIDQHQKYVEWAGTIVRGLSTGSVLLLVSYGLAITFGQMGVINMAHGEFIAIGGYTVYLIQNYFAETYGAGTTAYGWYFAISLPFAFLAAALAGAILEKGMIRFLYSRPLESLLATWGVSMVLQQVFRLKFGAANVSVSSPEWLRGSYEFAGVALSYNRLLLIAFAFFVILATWLLMNKTSWGLHVRATMQNRQMASNLGVPSGRVNMLTFAFGSGLAGLAGAFISQIGNVGPSMGQTYIVDSFMVVVVGGVGNMLGAALSSLGIGMGDQILQPILGPVMGKITVLFAIILFLQFKPGGLFPARSRSLDD